MPDRTAACIPHEGTDTEAADTSEKDHQHRWPVRAGDLIPRREVPCECGLRFGEWMETRDGEDTR